MLSFERARARRFRFTQRTRDLAAVPLALTLLIAGCSGNESQPGGAGEVGGTGGAPASGGTAGSAPTGGATSGNTNAGGTTGGGTTGGASSGGQPATGGSGNAGGQQASGGLGGGQAGGGNGNAGGKATGGSGNSGGRTSGGGGSSGGQAGGVGGNTGGSQSNTGGAGGAGSPSSGCGMEPANGAGATLDLDGTQRQYEVAVPAMYDKTRAYPLVLAFHGAGLTGPQFRSFFNLVTPVARDGIVVYPTGIGGGWDVRRDVPFVDALIAKLEAAYCIDAQRIFATGHSNGGFFTNAVGCLRGDVLRAIAPMSGGQQQQASSCKGDLAVWISHGNVDDIVETSYGQQTRDFWVKRNTCTSMTLPVSPSPCVEYQGCASGDPVRYCEYDGDHNLMPMSAQTIWDFFKQF